MYILTGTDPDTGKPLAYIGEAEVIADRLRAHKGKDFWVHAYVFVSKDENLTKSHIRYLEGRLIAEAQTARRFTSENSQSSGAKLPESDREDMEVFLAKIATLLPVLGTDILIPVAVPSVQPSDRLTTSIKGLVAHGQRTPNGFVVFKGSQAVRDDRKASASRSPHVVKMRQRLLEDGTLVPEGDHFAFSTNIAFTSPSAARSVIHDGV